MGGQGEVSLSCISHWLAVVRCLQTAAPVLLAALCCLSPSGAAAGSLERGREGSARGRGRGRVFGGGSGTKLLNKLKSYQESPPFNLVNSEAAFFSFFFSLFSLLCS